MVAGAIVGLLIIILGIYVWYMYITTYVEEGNHFLFGLSLFQIGIGIYILFRASRSNNQGYKTDDMGLRIKDNTEQADQTNNAVSTDANPTTFPADHAPTPATRPIQKS